MAGENLVNRPKTFKTWCENFWYHYKFHTITVIVAVVALAVILAQCATRTKYDYTVMLATSSVEWSSLQIKALEKELAECAEDINGDGEVNVLLADCTFNEQESGYQIIMAKKQKLQSMVMNEPSALILISDKASYDWINTAINNGFSENTNLPHGDGHYYDMTESSFLINAKKSIDSGFIWPDELIISRRRVKGTLFESKKGMSEITEAADKFIKNIITYSSN